MREKKGVRGNSAVAGDVADRLRLQAQLLDSVRESVVATDLEGRVLYWGRGAERLYGYKAAEVLGRPITFIVPPGREEEEQARMRHVAGTGSWSGEYEQVRKDGSRFWADTFISLVKDDDGEPWGFIGIDREITARRRTREILRRQAEIIDQIHDSVIATDLEGNVTLWNKGAERIFGYTAREMVGRHVSLLYHEEDRDQVASRVLEPLRRQGRHEARLRKRTKAGETRWVHISLSMLRDDAGEPVGMIGYSMDITDHVHAEQERKRMELRLQQTQKLESLGILAGGIAHDFNNLLTGILGNANLARLEVEPRSSAESYLRRIEESAQRAAELCRQMLAYSGRGHFVMQVADLNRLIEETTDLLKLSISKKVAIDFRLAPDLPPVRIDAVQIRQILMNLVTNASEAIGDDGGRITIVTGRQHVDREFLERAYLPPELPEGSYVLLEVRDDGCGMRPETRARIFDPFFTTKFAGRGLGLAAALGIARGHGGALAVESEPGRGSTFRLVLPPARGVPAEPRPPTVARSELRVRGKALVVDDEESVRDVLRPMLEEIGFEVSFAVDGRQGLERFRQSAEEIQVVLLDLTMPNLDGEETYRELRRIRPEVPVILMSGYSRQDAVHRFGADTPVFLPKPFPLDRLEQALRDVLGRSVTG